jgi:hydrogenase maturation protein HypF
MPAQTSVEAQGLRIHVTGIVQGVGFRPFVYGLAHRRHGLTGWVRNTSAGVDIEADGPADCVWAILHRRAARRNCRRWPASTSLSAATERPPDGFTCPSPSASPTRRAGRVPAHLARRGRYATTACASCSIPTDRRHRYPFINCTNCGPRYHHHPRHPLRPAADDHGRLPALRRLRRPNTADPLDRRFHAQPVACPDMRAAPVARSDRVRRNRPTRPRRGRACKPRRALSCATGPYRRRQGAGRLPSGLRRRQSAAAVGRTAPPQAARRTKPFAVMLPDIEAVRPPPLSTPAPAEEELLLSRARPIVVCSHRRRRAPPSPPEMAPGQRT